MSVTETPQEKQEQRCKHDLVPRDYDFCLPVRDEIARKVALAPRTLGELLERIRRGAA